MLYENSLNLIFRIILVLYTLLYALMKYYEEIFADHNDTIFYIHIFDTILLLVPIVYYFRRLFKIMKKKHNYEYLKAYKSMTIYFGGLIFAEFVCFSMCYLKFKLWSKIDSGLG